MIVEVDDDMVLGAVKVGQGPQMKCYTGSKKLNESRAEFLAVLMLFSRNVEDVMAKMWTVGGRNNKNKQIAHIQSETVLQGRRI